MVRVSMTVARARGDALEAIGGQNMERRSMRTQCRAETKTKSSVEVIVQPDVEPFVEDRAWSVERLQLPAESRKTAQNVTSQP